MKYILIILISFSFVSPALAAKAGTGSVPVLQPLQPAPAGISPAFNRNIQYQDPNYSPNSGGPNGGQSQQNQQTGQNSALTGSMSLVAQNADHNYIWWLAALLAAVLVGFFVYKKYKD